MAKSGGYTIENLYEPGYSSFNPSESVPHYLGKNNLIPASQMGMTLDPRTANQLSELSRSLNIGTKTAEVGTMDMATFDTIPKHHWEEMRRKAKLSGANLSLHAPIQDMDPSGFGQQGWDSSKKELVERQLKDVIDKAALLDKDGNIPVTIHGANTSGSTFKMVDGKKEYEMLIAVDRETGQLAPAKEEIKYYPGGEDGKIIEKRFTPSEQLDAMNNTKWDDTLKEIEFKRESADKVLNNVNPIFQSKYLELVDQKIGMDELNMQERSEIKKIITAGEHIEDAEMKIRAAFSKVYKFAEKDGNKKELEDLDILSKNYAKQLQYDEKEGKPTIFSRSPSIQSEAIFSLVRGLKALQPKLFDTIENFSIEKGSETFANVALHSYKEYGEGAPVVSIENLYQGMGFSQAKDLKNLVEKSQETFVKKAIEEEGMSKSQAENIAKKLIGVTFDVGHLNISRAHGFKPEHLVKEAEQIRKHVKHVHITDNFGYSDTHLPIGMGNVPVQALLEALGDEGERARKINEVGGWFQHFKSNPFGELLGAAGSQIYSTGDGPTWAQTGGFQQSYIEGYGQMLPDIHYQTFGAGFSQLPQSLGGSRGQNGQGRMGGGGF